MSLEVRSFVSFPASPLLTHVIAEYGFDYELVTYKWPHWLRSQKEKQRTIWGYKILFLDVLFPLELDRVIFVDSDQYVDFLFLPLPRCKRARLTFLSKQDRPRRPEGAR